MLFPVIAELFHVPIGVLFGEGSEEEKVPMDLGSERNFVFEPLEDIEIVVGNPCDIEVKDGESDHASLHVEGDLKFVEYISAEIIDGKLYVNIKNPTGSDNQWIPYDRGDYRKSNRIVIHSGAVDSNCCITNYLDLVLSTRETIDHTYKWTCRKENASGKVVGNLRTCWVLRQCENMKMTSENEKIREQIVSGFFYLSDWT